MVTGRVAAYRTGSPKMHAAKTALIGIRNLDDQTAVLGTELLLSAMGIIRYAGRQQRRLVAVTR